MKTLTYSTNGNGRLLLPCFPDLRRFEKGKYHVNDRVIINLTRRGEMGIAEIRNLRVFKLGALTDAASLCICGQNAPWLISVMKKMYPGSDANTLFVMLILNYTERFMAVQNEVVQEYWNDQTDQHPTHKLNAHQLMLIDDVRN
jgi:hypothetical protein